MSDVLIVYVNIYHEIISSPIASLFQMGEITEEHLKGKSHSGSYFK